MRWESTTIAGTLLGLLEESGASPLIQIRHGSSALFHSVLQHMIVKKVIHLVPIIMAVWLSQLVEELVKDGRPWRMSWWENTTIAGTHLGLLMVSGVTLPQDLSSVLFQNVGQC